MISIITPIYNIGSHLPGFISSMSKLEKQLKKSFKGKILNEIILINNNPKKDLRKVGNVNLNVPNLKIIQNKKNIGFGAACNQGMKIAKGEYMLILNPDVKIEARSLQELLKIIKQNKKANIISCKLLNEDGSLQHSCKRFPTFRALLARRIKFPFALIFKKELDRYSMKEYDHKKPKKVDWVSGALMFMRKRYYFDERYFMYFEDADLCRRVGNVYYYPSVSVMHKAERQSARNIRLFFLHASSMIHYFYKFSVKRI